MKVFEIDRNAIKQCWESHQKWFSKIDYTIKGSKELALLEKPDDVAQSTFYISLGFIPYVSVTDVEVMKAFVDTLTNKKLVDTMKKVELEKYEEIFWKYCNLYPDMASDYSTFEDTYVVNKIKSWCNENSIECI